MPLLAAHLIISRSHSQTGIAARVDRRGWQDGHNPARKLDINLRTRIIEMSKILNDNHD
jgi:hypothetical protein